MVLPVLTISKVITAHVLNFMVYNILWISWYAYDARKLIHKTILETHVALITTHSLNVILLMCICNA